MSNEMISVPRGWALDYAKLLDSALEYGAAEEVRALLAKPTLAVKRYDQHPVDSHSDVEITVLPYGTHYDHGPNLAEALARLACRVARFYKLEAPTLANPAAQPQGKAVAAQVCAYTPGMGQVELKLPGNLPSWLELGETVTVLHGDAQPQGEPLIWVSHCLRGSQAGKFFEVPRPEWEASPGLYADPIPLYAHPDAGEVEKQRRLKMILAERVQNAEANCSVYRYELDTLRAEVERLKDEAHQDGLLRVRYSKEFDTLHAQLGELPEKLIVAIDLEQERLSAEDYLMDSEDCIKVIRETLSASAEPAKSSRPTPGTEALTFTLMHPFSKERRTVTLTKADVADGMEDTLYEKLADQICRCESVGETNVVDCNCDEYTHDFDLVAEPATEGASHE